nr:EOG090X06W9 [Cyclestheria hislopi]
MSEDQFSVTELENTETDEPLQEANDEKDTIQSNENVNYQYPVYEFDKPLKLMCSASKEFELLENRGFLKGCKWSPDGTCLLTCAEDCKLRLFDLPTELYYCKDAPFQGINITEMTPSLRIKEGELVYDYCWYPLMSSWEPQSCLLASTAKNNPIHLWDAYTGKLINTYRAYNHVDEVEAATSLCMDPSGEKLYCGFNKCVRIFNVDTPGRQCETRPTKSSNGISASQSGIISCIAVNPALPSVYAAASYLKTVGLYSEPDGTTLCILEGHRGGVTHVKFSPDGLLLYTGGRKDPEIICWDLRNPSSVLFTVKRTVETNQRIYFDLDPSGRYLLSGDTGGLIRIWDTLKAVESSGENDIVLSEIMSFRTDSDCTNGVSCHPWLPLIATSSGQRHVPNVSQRDDSDSETDDDNSEESPFIRTDSDCTNGVSCHPWLPLIATSSGQRHVPNVSQRDDSDSETDDDNSEESPEYSVKLWWAGHVIGT